jgi:hypothetical protein
LALQFGELDDAALLGGMEAVEQVGQRNIHAVHCVGASVWAEPFLNEPSEASGNGGGYALRLEGGEGRAMHDQRDVDIAAGAFIVVLDVAEHESDLVEVTEVIGDLLPFLLHGCCLDLAQPEKASGSGKTDAENVTALYDFILRLLPANCVA